jgi:hypothetical protein
MIGPKDRAFDYQKTCNAEEQRIRLMEDGPEKDWALLRFKLFDRLMCPLGE